MVCYSLYREEASICRMKDREMLKIINDILDLAVTLNEDIKFITSWECFDDVTSIFAVSEYF